MNIRNILIVFLVLLLGLALQLEAQTGAAKGKGRARGKVIDEQGKPISDVKVRFSNEELGASFELTTDSKGEWVANGIAGGNWNIDFIKQGYETRGIVSAIKALSYNKPIELSLKAAAAAPAGAAGAKKEAPKGLDLVAEADAMKEKKDYAGALTKYEAALQVNPDLYSLYGDIGNLYLQMNQPDKAVEAYQKFLERDPENAEARIAAATALLQSNKTDEAKTLLENKDLSSITNPYILYNLGASFYNAQQVDEAIQYWEKSIALDPKLVDAHFQLGLAYYSAKQNDKAKASFQKVIELAPDTENAKMAQEMLGTIQ